MKEIFVKEAFGILHRIKNRDFSGNTGQAVKNTMLNFGASSILKIGSLLFTIIIARMLLPELFGLYSLALSTITFLSIFSDLGIGTTLITLVSKELVKRKNNAGAYLKYLFNIKIYLTIVSCVILTASAYFIAHFYYDKPIFLALLSGAIYIIANSLITFYVSIFQSINKFQATIYKEIIFQVSRIILVPVSILLFVAYSTEIKILAVFIALSLSYILSLIYLYAVRPKFSFTRSLNTKEKGETKKLIIPLTATVISGMFFGYIDTIVLGRFVDSTYIGYYSAAMALAGSASSMIGFSAAIFPIFSRLSGERLRLGLKKAIAVSLPISILALIGTILLSKYVILIVYGQSFLPAVPVLLALSGILIIDPLIAIYTNYHIVIKNQFFIAKTLLFTTVLNIILNVVFVYYAVKYFSPEVALISASIAIILARGIYLLQLMFKNKQRTNFS